ncbi:phosphoesterase [Lecanosticta acicola]|uniref:Phosphoesterase n=1 Tax=Lecanosticta acicola TaxID=111012 RepID=A0AAI9EFG9_9PEZI|nr:phosphoesterase [Lecanosticta acicola]
MRTAAFLGLLALSASASAAPGSSAAQAGSSRSIQNMKQKIKNVLILEMENRSLDNLLGGQTIKGLENPINNGPFCNPLNVSQPNQGYACTGASDYDEILDDPDHAIYGNNIEWYGEFTPDNAAVQSGQLQATMQGFCDEQIRLYNAKENKSVLAHQVMHYYTEEQVPVLTALTNNFVVMNNWFSDIPGPTNPNRVALTSGTSAGKGANNFNNGSMMQRSIFQQLSETHHTWKNYVTDTTMQDALWYNWTYTSGNTKLVQPMSQFYADAANGSLPEFTFLNPSCCGVGTSSMHPTGLVSDGERLIKNIYEALRASPQWNSSLLIITFDETGGFHDHMPPPLAVRPDNLTYTATTPNGQNYTFHFDRLGGRMPTWLISPWVEGAHVEKTGTNCDRETVAYSSTSILRTLGYLWNFGPFTPRVEKAPSFDHLVRAYLRTDTPAKLPEVVTF